MSGKRKKPPRRPRQGPAQSSTPAPQGQTQVSGNVQSISLEYSGPLPHPNHLAQFDQVLPGAAERILTGYETQAAHRQALEKKVTDANVRSQSRGVWIGFTIVVMVLGVAIWLITNGYRTEGMVALGVDIAGPVSVFVIGRREQRLERRDKMRMMGFQ